MTVFIVGVKATVIGVFSNGAEAIRAGIEYTKKYPYAKVWYDECKVTGK